MASTAPVVPWHGIREAALILLSGNESFLADRALQILQDRMRNVDPQLEIIDLDASTYGEGELLYAASPSLFGEPRLIRITGVEGCTDAFLIDALA
jgi:DNA polymerase-3 subunit delta